MTKATTKNARTDDLPAPGKTAEKREQERDARHKRLVTIRMNGSPAWWDEAVASIGNRPDPIDLARQAFAAFEEAMREALLRTEFRPQALAETKAQAEALRVLIAAMRNSEIVYREAEVSPVRLAGLSPKEHLAGCSPNWRLMRESVEAEAAVLEARRLALTDSQKPSSRTRLFAEKLLPVFEREWPQRKGVVPSFRDFLLAASRLVAETMPSQRLATSVATDVLRASVLHVNLKGEQWKWTRQRPARIVPSRPQPPPT